MIKNLPCNAGDMGSIPDQGTKIPHPVEQLSLHTTMIPHDNEDLSAVTKAQCSQSSFCSYCLSCCSLFC